MVRYEREGARGNFASTTTTPLSPFWGRWEWGDYLIEWGGTRQVRQSHRETLVHGGVLVADSQPAAVIGLRGGSPPWRTMRKVQLPCNPPTEQGKGPY